MSVDMEAEDRCFVQHVEEGDELREMAARLAASGRSEAGALYRRFSQIVTKYQEQPQLLDPLLEDLVKPLAGLLLRLALAATGSEGSAGGASVDAAAVADVSRFLWLLSTVRGYRVVLRFFPNEVANFEPVVGLLGRLTQMEAARQLEEPSVWEAQYVLLLWLSMLVLIPFHLSLVDSSLSGTAGAAGCGAAAAPLPPGTPPAGAGQPPPAAQAQQQQQPAAAAAPYPPIVGSILDLCRGYLGSAGSVREMAAAVVARLVTRPDMRAALDEWVGWGCQALQQRGDADFRAGFEVLGAALTLSAIFKLGKRDALLGPAARVFPAAAALLGSKAAATNALARKLAVKLIQRIGLVFLRPRLAAWRYSKGRSALLGRAAAGSAASAGSAAAAAGAAAEGPGGGTSEDGMTKEQAEAEEDVEHAEHLEGVVEALLTGLGDRDTVVRWSAAKGMGRVTGRLPKDLADDVVGSVLESFFTPGASDTAWHGGCLAVAELARRGLLLPERLGEVVPLVAKALEYDVRRGPCSVGAHVRDAAAYVCWAFARAYTPEALGAAAGQLAPALICLACYDREVNCRRAAAAAYQECVGRLGSFPHGIQILTAADYFTVSTRSAAYLTVGPYVAGFPEYFEPLARHLLLVKLRHWEKALRELAAAALAALVPHRPAYFASTALPLLLPLVTDHVLEVRHGAVAGIAELLPALRAQGVALGAELEAAAADIIPAMDRAKVTRGKGGEVMRTAICRLIQTSSEVGLLLSQEQQACLHSHLCDNLRHSSPEVQQAAAAALGAFARRHLPAPTPEALQLSTSHFLGELRGSAGNPLARRGAALALGALPRWLLEPLRSEVLAGLGAAVTEAGTPPEARDPEARANAVRALGQVTLALYFPSAATAAAAAAGGVLVAAGATTADAVDSSTSRGAALAAPVPAAAAGAAAGAACAAADAGAVIEGEGEEALGEEAVQQVCSLVIEPMLLALEDYTTDNRGDVGSWVREAAMEQLALLLGLLLPQLFGPAGAATEGLLPSAHNSLSLQGHGPLADVVPRALLGLLRQSAERISRVREAAARALQALLPAAAAAGVPGAREAAAALCTLPLEGFVTGEALAPVACLLGLGLPSMQSVLLEGLAFSIGGLDNQLAEAAGDALSAAVQQVADQGEGQLHQLAGVFVGLWEELQQGGSRGKAGAAGTAGEAAAAGGGGAARHARLATPMLAAADVLLSRTPLRDLLVSPSSWSSTNSEEATAAAVSGLSLRDGTAAAGAAALSSSSGTEAASSVPDVRAWGLGGRLLACVRGEVRGCTDVPRLHLAACVLCQVAELPQPVKGAALASAIGLLANRYPKVRRYAAEQLYTALLTLDPEEWGPISPGPMLPDGSTTAIADTPDAAAADTDASAGPDVEAALELLSETAWDGPLDAVRAPRSRLYRCFGLPEPRLLPKQGSAAGGGGPVGPGGGDENASYQALIDRAMRGM